MSTYAPPPTGPEREHARNAVARGGSLLVAEFDVSLADSGRMEEDRTTLDELATAVADLDIECAEVRARHHTHGHDTQEMPAVVMVAHRKPRDTVA